MIFFVGGLNGYIWAEWYSLYLKMLAAHGFFVIGVDYKFPLMSHFYNENLSQDIPKFFEELDFVSSYYVSNVMFRKRVTATWDPIRESPAQFENRIMAPVLVLCTKKLHFVSRNWRMENKFCSMWVQLYKNRFF